MPETRKTLAKIYEKTLPHLKGKSDQEIRDYFSEVWRKDNERMRLALQNQRTLTYEEMCKQVEEHHKNGPYLDGRGMEDL